VFESISVPDAAGWRVTEIWSNGFNVAADSVSMAEWSIRRDMGQGDAGVIVAEDISPVTQVATGRAYVVTMPPISEPEYSFQVSGIGLLLPSGEYWLNVTPFADQALISTTSGANGVGTPIGDAGIALWWLPSLGHVYDVLSLGFSIGVAGTVPEPATTPLAAFAALGLLGHRRRRPPIRVACA